MDSPVAVVRAEAVFEVVGENGHRSPVDVGLEFTTSDPYAVSLQFYVHQAPVTWLMSRDLLAEALIMDKTGEGDVRFRTSLSGEILMQFESDTGTAELHLSATEVADFLLATYDVVPLGEECAWFNIDRELEKLMVPTSDDYQ